VIDPKDTRTVLSLALATAHHATAHEHTPAMDYGVFRM
jgi:hypothetical protein